jgi:hypothetical protein
MARLALQSGGVLVLQAGGGLLLIGYSDYPGNAVITEAVYGAAVQERTPGAIVTEATYGTAIQERPLT